jgi:hypothetical protein
MEVAIETSLKYPWVNQGWKKMLVGGGIFLLGYIGAVFCGTVIAVILTAAYQSLVQDVVQSEVNTIARMLGTLFGFIFSFAYLPILYFYMATFGKPFLRPSIKITIILNCPIGLDTWEISISLVLNFMCGISFVICRFGSSLL